MAPSKKEGRHVNATNGRTVSFERVVILWELESVSDAYITLKEHTINQ